ncbi:kinase-like domain-containing protein [Phellopilus nigrolimitatus]|nr:kinase-like domain-containing protein [Phellopilus nigrolimitatus]
MSRSRSDPTSSHPSLLPSLNGAQPLPPPPRGVASLARGAPAATRIPPSLQAKMAAMANRASNQQAPSPSGTHPAQHPGLLRTFQSSPAPTGQQGGPALGRAGLAAKRNRPNFNIRDIIGPEGPGGGGGASGAGLGAGVPQEDVPMRRAPPMSGSPFSNFDKIVDINGALNFDNKAVLHADGVNFSNGSSFAINMTQMELLEELGRGNYGTVKKVLHKPTRVLMAMKEIRLELDDAKLSAILMELDILHRAVSSEIVEFYGAFFIESCVYYCMEFMDAGSLDTLQGAGVPEDVLARITHRMIIHRDVKPTNVLVNKKGDIKLCDFGVSGQLEKSLAKTNIGCQSYMAPERIKGESQNKLGTYTVSSDVWSLGLSVIEISLGRYPYPPETYQNVFAQLTAIVHGPPPELPEGYSDTAQDFVQRCLIKEPERRATYAELLEHPFLLHDMTQNVDMVGWVLRAFAYREAQHTSPASSASSSSSGSSAPESIPPLPPADGNATDGAPARGPGLVSAYTRTAYIQTLASRRAGTTTTRCAAPGGPLHSRRTSSRVAPRPARSTTINV